MHGKAETLRTAIVSTARPWRTENRRTLGTASLGRAIRILTVSSEGGAVVGPGTGTSDDIPALLSNGEFVVNAQATARYRAVLEAMNGGGLPGFARGGLVGRADATGGPSGAGPGGRMVIELGEGLEARILERANNNTVDIVRQGIGQYDRMIPERVREVTSRPRDR